MKITFTAFGYRRLLWALWIISSAGGIFEICVAISTNNSLLAFIAGLIAGVLWNQSLELRKRITRINELIRTAAGT